jgi:hypothetical protein
LTVWQRAKGSGTAGISPDRGISEIRSIWNRLAGKKVVSFGSGEYRRRFWQGNNKGIVEVAPDCTR